MKVTESVVRRPWGQFEVLREASDFKLKLISVEPGQRLSLQRHQHRAEHWTVLSGVAQVEVDGVHLELAAGQSVDIPRRAWHRLTNAHPQPLLMAEVQTGDSFAEDDIERRSDDYGRAG